MYPKVRVCATYDTVEWTDDQDGNSEPLEDGGFCDPLNPWGSKEGTSDETDRVVVTFDSLGEAAEFIVDFPGAVWDWSDMGASEQQRDGRYKRVCAHVMDHAETVHQLADWLNHCGARGRYYVKVEAD